MPVGLWMPPGVNVMSAAQNMYIFDQVVADSCLKHFHVLCLSNIYSDDLYLFSPELRL